MIYSVFANVRTPQSHIRHTRKGGVDFEYIKQSLIPFAGKCKVVVEYDEFWDRTGNGRTFTSKVIESPSWKKLFELAKQAQKTTGDFHHDFFEGAEVRRVDEAGVQIITLYLGS